MKGERAQGQFDVAVDRWVAKAKEAADLAFQTTVQDALARVKELTPVDTGYLRANWTVALPGDVMPVAAWSQHPEEVIAKLAAGDQVYIVNPVPYAMRIEFGYVGMDSKGRFYDQKGRGMMQQTIAEMPRIAEAATQRVRQEVSS
jgi:hypothetical protein